MNLDKTQLTNMTSRQKAIAGGVLLVVIIIIWQLASLFKGGGSNPPAVANAKINKAGMAANANGAPGAPNTPQPGQISQPAMSVQQQNDLVKLQQETQEKYVSALNELQMLKLTQQIADTNKDIAKAKLDTVTAEKGIIDLLTKPAAPVETSASFAPGLVTPGAGGNLTMQQPGSGQAGSTQLGPPGMSQHPTALSVTPPPAPVNYIVISVSELLNKWSAVLGYQGNLYSVFIGDVLPPDQSTVVAIDKYSVILEKDGIQRKLSLVPII